jgi:hypothetical protein
MKLENVMPSASVAAADAHSELAFDPHQQRKDVEDPQQLSVDQRKKEKEER